MTTRFVSDAEMAEHRADAESRMTSTCIIRRANGLAAQQSGGRQPRAWLIVKADQRCRVSGSARGAAASRTVATDGGDVEVQVRTLHLPHGTTGLVDGDLVEVTAGDSAGQVLRIVEVSTADQTTALRLPVVGARRPEEW